MCDLLSRLRSSAVSHATADRPRSDGVAGTIPKIAVIDVWLAQLDDADSAQLRRNLAQDELIRADSYLVAVAARRYVAARGILREILGDYLGCAAGDVPLCYGDHGKPLLGQTGTPALYFNVSHAAGYAAYAICASADVGIDIECDESRIDPKEIARAICSADELRRFEATPAAEQRELFFRLWTRKEAYAKCLGFGLTVELSRLEVPMTDAAEMIAGAGDRRCAIRAVKFADRSLAGFQVSIAARASRTELRRVRSWPGRAPMLYAPHA